MSAASGTARVCTHRMDRRVASSGGGTCDMITQTTGQTRRRPMVRATVFERVSMWWFATYINDVIESAGSEQCIVQSIHAIGGAHNHHSATDHGRLSACITTLIIFCLLRLLLLFLIVLCLFLRFGVVFVVGRSARALEFGDGA
jgi:hypothetical protein